MIFIDKPGLEFPVKHGYPTKRIRAYKKLSIKIKMTNFSTIFSNGFILRRVDNLIFFTKNNKSFLFGKIVNGEFGRKIILQSRISNDFPQARRLRKELLNEKEINYIPAKTANLNKESYGLVQKKPVQNLYNENHRNKLLKRFKSFTRKQQYLDRNPIIN